MLQIGRNADLAEKSLHAEHCGEVGVEDLERDRAVVLEIMGEKDSRHATGADAALHGVATVESALELLRNRHR